LKILFVLGRPNPLPSASWTRIGFFAKDWSKKGHSVEVLGTFSYETLQKRGVGKIGQVKILNLIFNIGLSHPLIFTLNSIISFIVSTFFLLAKKPNVTVVSVPSGDAGLGALMACKLLKAKCVVDYRDEWEDYAISLINHKTGKLFYSIIRKLAACLYVRSQLIVAVTPNFATSLKLRGVTDVRLVWNGADITVFKPYAKNIAKKRLALNDTDFTIVYSGLIGGYYKLDIVIRALAKMHNQTKSIKLMMIGDGPDLPLVLGLPKKLGLCDKVLYLGVKNDKNEIAEILSAGDVGIIPELYAKGQLPAKFFEYCACGIPVLATVYEDSLLATFIREYRIGVTSPPMDEGKLAEAIYWIYKDKSFREAAGKRARTLIEEKFDRTKIAENFLTLIEAI